MAEDDAGAALRRNAKARRGVRRRFHSRLDAPAPDNQPQGMKPLFLTLRFFGAMLLAGGLLSPLLSAQTSEQRAVNPSGEWQCHWINASGAFFTGQVTLSAKDDGTLSGQIVWTFQKSPLAEDQAKLGLSGTEFIRGTYDFKTRLVLFEGYRKDDPREVIGLDRYKLVFADNGAALGGLTADYGKWTAFFSAVRK
jgi:hypothetical protein